MTSNKWLGHISRATFGLGGYQDAMLGLTLCFEGEAGGVCIFVGWWPTTTEVTKRTKWTEEERGNEILKAVYLLQKTLQKAGKRHVEELIGVPVEVCSSLGEMCEPFEGWRVLTEVMAVKT